MLWGVQPVGPNPELRNQPVESSWRSWVLGSGPHALRWRTQPCFFARADCWMLLAPVSEAYTEKIPKSPVRELLELEPETAKFE